MIDRQAIIGDLIAHKLTHAEIATKHRCSSKTVTRLVKEHNLYRGQGIKHFWEFSQSSLELAFLVGVYLTDGWLQEAQFAHSSVSIDYIQRTKVCLEACGLPASEIRILPLKEKAKQTQYAVHSYCKMFRDWLKQECGGKARIPAFVWEAPIEHRVAFLSAAIDGDGHVDIDGTIRIRLQSDWLRQLPEFLATIGVRSNGCQITEILPSGKEYLRVSIRRSDFRKLNPQLTIAEKQQRILYATNTRPNRRPKRYKYPCPICGDVSMTHKDGKYCRACYLQSEDFHQHLVNIAPLGNKAGNNARWHKS